MKNLFVIFSAAIFMLLQSGCSDENSILGNSECECEVGDTLIVELGSSCTVSLLAAYTAGYKWEIQKGFDERFVELESYSITDPDPDSDLDGKPMLQEWTYQTRMQGTVCVTLIYMREWEEAPVSTRNIVAIIE